MPAAVIAQEGDGREVPAALVHARARGTEVLKGAAQTVGYVLLGQAGEAGDQVETTVNRQGVQVRC